MAWTEEARTVFSDVQVEREHSEVQLSIPHPSRGWTMVQAIGIVKSPEKGMVGETQPAQVQRAIRGFSKAIASVSMLLQRFRVVLTNRE